MSDASSRNVLVTGGARRIGAAIARDLASEGWNVAVHYQQSAEEAENLVTEIQAAGGNAVALQAELSQEAQTNSLVEAATEEIGAITCLINNASVFEPDTIDTVSSDSWDHHLKVNLQAPLFLSQRFSELLPNNETGNIINLLDQRVWNLTPYFISYTISKSALWTMTQSLALALAPRIRVNGIGPGPALPSPRQSSDQFAEQCAATPLGKGTSPEEISRTVKFILSSRSMTGQMIALDGGQHLGWAQPDDETGPIE
ncbi:MAG: short chain dehydrogenase [Rhodospirillaceae bacterium]|mgnify:CR=1 FL=1|nr:short chain dehydrogenase [Rhodospirillaceae bacterium]|tara:strand:+ start:11031 stop:11801 length:771 start_codon:yes stop_codon:yes gene_type:complete